jgi:hypothetical protein
MLWCIPVENRQYPEYADKHAMYRNIIFEIEKYINQYIVDCEAGTRQRQRQSRLAAANKVSAAP